MALYYLTNWAEGVSYSRPEALYYWVYYVGLNLPWAIVPLCTFPPNHFQFFVSAARVELTG